MLETLPRDDTPTNEPAHLRDYWHVVLRRRWLAITVMAMTVGAAAAYIALVKPVYEARAQILIERELPNVLDFDRNPRATESAAEDYYQTQFRLLQSRLLARRVVERLGLENDPEFGASAVDAFQKRLRIQPIKNSQMVTVAFESLRPDLAARAANAMVEAYIQQTLEFRYRVSAEAGAWLADETTEQSKKVEEAQGALERFKQEAGLVNFEERKALVEQKLRDVGASLTVARTRRIEKAALYEQMRAASNPEELPDAIRSPLIQALRTELATLERQGSELEAKGYLNEHPEVVRLRQQVDGTRQKIALEARRLVRAAQNEYDVAASQETSLVSALEAAKAEALDLSRRSSTYEALSRDLEASKKLSDSVLARQKQTDVARNVKASNIHVIDPALTPGPAHPAPAAPRSRPRRPAGPGPGDRGRLLSRLSRHFGGAARRRSPSRPAPARGDPRNHGPAHAPGHGRPRLRARLRGVSRLARGLAARRAYERRRGGPSARRDLDPGRRGQEPHFGQPRPHPGQRRRARADHRRRPSATRAPPAVEGSPHAQVSPRS